MKTIVVSGAIANKPGNSGGAWERLSWVVGLRRLGFDVWFVEQIAAETCVDNTGRRCPPGDSLNLQWFQSVTRCFGLAERAALIFRPGDECVGASLAQLLEVANETELLVNLSGHLTWTPLLERFGRKAYVDVDPGFTQYWHADPAVPFKLAEHDCYFTIGENIGQPDCPIPTCGICWRPVRQPVVLSDWPVTGPPDQQRFTTVASWRGAFGQVEAAGRRFGLKAHEFRKFLALPRRVPAQFEIALDIHEGDARDRAALEENGWRLADPKTVAGDPAGFRRYLQDSWAEYSVAQGIYVETNSGWFSERTARYLASGKPALVQDTGFGRNVPVGEGLLSFRTLDEAVTRAEQIAANYQRHCRAARAIAEEYFASDKVLGKFIEEALSS